MKPSSIYSKKETNSNQGQGITEYALILALVAAGVALILALMGTNINDVYSQILAALSGEMESDLPPGTIQVTVLDEQDQGVADTSVYAFDGDGGWTGKYGRTDSTGVALFTEMDDGDYQFLAYRNSNYFWSPIISYPRQDRTTITMQVRPFTVTVVDGDGQGIRNVWVYAFMADGQYWSGVYARTGANGRVEMEIPDGDYRFGAYYRSRWYWSDSVNSPAASETSIIMEEDTITVTVVDDAGQGITTRVNVYAYTEQEWYSGVSRRTDHNGRVELTVPAGDYKFRVYYRASNYWSPVVNVPDADDVTIETGERPFTVNAVDGNGQPVRNVRVYAFTGTRAYTGLGERTDNSGQAIFRIPDGNYTFRADYRGRSFWSAIVSNPGVTSTTVTVGGR